MQITQFWDACLKQFKDELSPQQFNTWIRPLQVRADATSLTLLAPNRFVQNWIRERFLSRIEAEANEFFGRSVAVALNVGESPAALSIPDPAEAIAAIARPAPIKVEAANASSLNVEFTFENFVTGKANQLARAAGMQVSGNPGAAYNPLLVYGG
ncbi:MAG: DnaA N-terminal domain-containing protein, partial [Betaproteobacteria bacterium]